MKYLSTGAIMSDCGTWRYSLWRTWSFFGDKMIFVGLNPSTADDKVDDNTIRRCVRFARNNGCGRLTMLNLFAFRAKDPWEMKAAADPVGPHNDVIIKRHFEKGGITVVAAWGVEGFFKNRDREVMKMYPVWKCLGTTKHGFPRHPLYLKSDSPLIPYKGRL